MPPSPSARRGEIRTLLEDLTDSLEYVDRHMGVSGYAVRHGRILAARAFLASPERSDSPITADALHAFLAPGVTTWTMTSADLGKLAEWITESRG